MSMPGHVLIAFRLFLCICFTETRAPTTLRFVNVLFRHGDRYPIHAFPGDLHNESAWPQGYGQLSQVGMQQAFALGSYLRARYTGYLSESYRKQEVYMQSTAMDRIMMSAQCVLTGLFPPAGRQVWRQELAWQPIPIHTTNIGNEKLLHYGLVQDTCPVVKKHLDEFEEHSIIKELKIRHQALMDKLSNVTNGEISKIGQLSNLYDGLLCEKLHNLKWPWWTSDDMMSTIKPIKVAYKYQKWCGSTPVIRLTGGMLLEKMLLDMRLIARNMLNGNLKATLYAAHDTTVLALMCALDVYNHRLVPYATSMYVELHHTGPDVTFTPDMRGWYVQIWLRNDTHHDPYPLTIPGCAFNCSLSELINLTQASISDNWIADCGYLTFPYFTKLWHIVLITIAAGVAIVFLLLVATSCCNGMCTRRRLRARPSTYGKLRASSEVNSRPEEMSMLGSMGGDSDIEG